MNRTGLNLARPSRDIPEADYFAFYATADPQGRRLPISGVAGVVGRTVPGRGADWKVTADVVRWAERRGYRLPPSDAS